MSAPTALHRASHADYSARTVADRRAQTVVACIPAQNEASSIEAIVTRLVTLQGAGVVDRVLVVDDSTDATPRLAQQAGAEVVRQTDLDPELGPVRGKGDAMWRALGICHEDVVCFLDGDSADFGEQHVIGLVASVAAEGYAFAKGTYRRPFVDVRGPRPSGGGRVTELTAKPLLRALFPELGAFSQPLAGEIAVRTDLLRSLPLATGYAVDVALLIDVWRSVGLGQMAEVDLGSRQNRHRPLHELAAMADEVTGVILDRGRVAVPSRIPFERPPRGPRVPTGRPLT